MLNRILTLLGLRKKSPNTVFSAAPRSAEEIGSGLAQAVARRAGTQPEAIDPDRTFAELGFDSLQAMKFTGQLEKDLGLELDPTLMWDHPTINGLTSYLARHLGVEDGRRSIA